MGASPALGRLLSADREVRDAVALVRQLTPSYSQGDRARVVGRNRRLPVRSRFYSDYLALQRLCVAILSDDRILLQGDAGRMRGVLFDGAWLWEEYVATLLGDEFFHPRNRAGEGRQYLFDGECGLIYPDFVSRDADARVVADAKYKPTDNVHDGDGAIVEDGFVGAAHGSGRDGVPVVASTFRAAKILSQLALTWTRRFAYSSSLRIGPMRPKENAMPSSEGAAQMVLAVSVMVGSSMEPGLTWSSSFRQFQATMSPSTIRAMATKSWRPLVSRTELAAVVAVAGMVPKRP